MRPYLVPRNPDTAAQRTVRGSFRDAVHTWQGMSLEEKREWNFRARYKSATGYNLFVSHYMKQACVVDDKISPGAKQAYSYVSHPFAQRFPSVAKRGYHPDEINKMKRDIEANRHHFTYMPLSP